MPIERRVTNEFFTVLEDGLMFMNVQVDGLVNEDINDNINMNERRNNDPPP